MAYFCELPTAGRRLAARLSRVWKRPPRYSELKFYMSGASSTASRQYPSTGTERVLSHQSPVNRGPVRVCRSSVVSAYARGVTCLLTHPLWILKTGVASHDHPSPSHCLYLCHRCPSLDPGLVSASVDAFAFFLNLRARRWLRRATITAGVQLAPLESAATRRRTARNSLVASKPDRSLSLPVQQDHNIPEPSVRRPSPAGNIDVGHFFGNEREEHGGARVPDHESFMTVAGLFGGFRNRATMEGHTTEQLDALISQLLDEANASLLRQPTFLAHALLPILLVETILDGVAFNLDAVRGLQAGD
ncbi:hypothetical protein BDK51DRAFT_48342 [Blyttiomyces helicus]|uniref:Uncharacterized protein n=1 Tax=Blyttiomyces helicus TaxID=388810 RepID=A0A4V1IPK5_9FUNG|nr:hypothetical protein BDK51DRAFT_48342 [Blyttiomyces helicus]|eukprot:RKO83377.1 hypothetical protein BDK51DRAFT_48342 [Blyttiomyces helicus]